MLIFKLKQVIFLYRCRNTNILSQIFFKWKNVIFWWFWPKNWKGWSDNVEIFHKKRSGVFERKKPKVRKFYHSSPSLWKLIFQKTNIFHYFISKNLKYSQIFPIWNYSRTRKLEQRYSLCQILKFQFPKGLNLECNERKRFIGLISRKMWLREIDTS